jgi:hypothetical protein
MKYSFFPFRRQQNTKNTIHHTLTQKAKHCFTALFQVNNPSPPHFTNSYGHLRTSATWFALTMQSYCRLS